MTEEEPKLKEYEKIIPGVTGTDFVQVACPVHGAGAYYERVEGDLFRCAHSEHKPVARRRIDIVPGPSKHLHGT